MSEQSNMRLTRSDYDNYDRGILPYAQAHSASADFVCAEAAMQAQTRQAFFEQVPHG